MAQANAATYRVDSPKQRLSGPVRYGNWNHVVVTRRGYLYTMWMNGIKVGSFNSAADFSDTENTNPLVVGGCYMAAGRVTAKYQGALDDFRIFHRCLSDKEIDDLYKAGGDEPFMHGEGRVKIGPLIEPPERAHETKIALRGPAAQRHHSRTLRRRGEPVERRPLVAAGRLAAG